jgi:hypothetical protein
MIRNYTNSLHHGNSFPLQITLIEYVHKNKLSKELRESKKQNALQEFNLGRKKRKAKKGYY